MISPIGGPPKNETESAGALGQAVDRLVAARAASDRRNAVTASGCGREELDVERARRAPAQPHLALAGVRLDPQREAASGFEPGGVEHAPHALLPAVALEAEPEAGLLGEQPAGAVAQPQREALGVDLDAGLVAGQHQRRRRGFAPRLAAVRLGAPFAGSRQRGRKEQGETRPFGEPLHR